MKRYLGRALSFVAVLAVASACGKTSPDEPLAKGNAYFEKGLLNEAIVEYRTAVQADQMRGDLHLKLAEALAKNGDFAAAKREYIRAADLLPTHVAAQIKAGQFLLISRQFDDAQE